MKKIKLFLIIALATPIIILGVFCGMIGELFFSLENFSNNLLDFLYEIRLKIK